MRNVINRENNTIQWDIVNWEKRIFQMENLSKFEKLFTQTIFRTSTRRITIDLLINQCAESHVQEQSGRESSCKQISMQFTQPWTFMVAETRPAIWRDADSCLHGWVEAASTLHGACNEMHNVFRRLIERERENGWFWEGKYPGENLRATNAINRESSLESNVANESIVPNYSRLSALYVRTAIRTTFYYSLSFYSAKRRLIFYAVNTLFAVSLE